MKGYSNDLYILAFDHRGTLTKGLLGVEGREPTDEEIARVSSMKDIIFDGFLEAKNNGISGGDQARYDSEIRPKLAVQVVEEMRERGADPDIWKIEGLDTTNDCENVSKVIKDGGREDVIAVVLGRGANDEKVNEWLRAGSSVDGYKGFAIGRSIFWDSLKGWHAGEKSREEAVSEIANSYLSFISVYQNGS